MKEKYRPRPVKAVTQAEAEVLRIAAERYGWTKDAARELCSAEIAEEALYWHNLIFHPNPEESADDTHETTGV